ncbi:hypothetical protein ONZ51_g12676 [Trametes cubensis]|uniref:Uncharacterized protein n=1 Tax=Trametes cubensis TaxID=1111947 RepID=A0AAD7X582_9APHY|nr:hypothetical protein ONZ51_g12676 [Trametes cubensis]
MTSRNELTYPPSAHLSSDESGLAKSSSSEAQPVALPTRPDSRHVSYPHGANIWARSAHSRGLHTLPSSATSFLSPVSAAELQVCHFAHEIGHAYPRPHTILHNIRIRA